jgi:hypothetical protein
MPDDLVEEYVLDDFGCDWGHAVAVNDAGIVLVVGYVGMQFRAISWNPMAGTTEDMGGMTGICPSAITADGVVLGTAKNRDGKSIAYLTRPGGRWAVDTGHPRFPGAGTWMAPLALSRRVGACSRVPATSQALATAGAGQRYCLGGLRDHGEE